MMSLSIRTMENRRTADWASSFCQKWFAVPLSSTQFLVGSGHVDDRVSQIETGPRKRSCFGLAWFAGNPYRLGLATLG